MNQGIQVLDGSTYIETKKAPQIEVMSMGQLLVCYICGADKESLDALYNSKQFEIEEIIEQELEEDKVNSNGELWLTAEQIRAY